MANKKIKAAATTGDDIGQMPEAERAAQAESTALVTKHQAAIEQVYGDGEDYTAERSIAKFQAHTGSGLMHFLKAGAELIRMKEHEERGQFLYIIEHRLRIAPRAAQKMMQAAAKFLTSEGKVRPLLADAEVGSTKLIELLTLDDVDLEAIEKGERVSGVDKDDIANMSVSELRAAIRAAREDKAADEELIGKKEERVSKLERDLAKAKRGGKDVLDAHYREELDVCRKALEETLGSCEKLLASVGVALTQLDETEVPAFADSIEKRSVVMNAVNRVNQLAETLARLQAGAAFTFATYIDDAQALLSTSGSGE